MKVGRRVLKMGNSDRKIVVKINCILNRLAVQRFTLMTGKICRPEIYIAQWKLKNEQIDFSKNMKFL